MARPPRQLSFAETLYRAMKTAGVTQSQLAQKVWGQITVISKGGQTITAPRNRDRLSQYLKGQTVPDPDTVKRLVEALNLLASGNTNPTTKE